MMEAENEDSLSVSALKWLYYSGAVNELLIQCQDKSLSSVVYKFVLHIDVYDLLQFNACLGDLVLHHPQSVWRLFVQVCYHMLTTVSSLPGLSSPAQLLLVIRLESLPALPPYVVDQVSDLSPLSKEPRFFMFSGVVTSLSLRETYTEAACLHCPSCSDQQHYIRLHTAGATEAMTMMDTTCYQCGGELTEEVSNRRLADKVQLIILPRRALCMCSQVHSRYQGLPMVIRGDLCDLVRVGGEYSVIGVPTHSLSDNDQHTTINTVIEVNNIMPMAPTPASNLPHNLTVVYRACQYSPWIFSATLAYSLAAHICPPGTYHRLKLALLVSLVSINPQTSIDYGRFSNLHLLAVGSDTPLLLQLLLYCGSLGRRSVLHSTTSDLYGTPRKEGTTCLIDGGGLVLAEGGLCLLGNISTMKKDHRDKLERTLESGNVDVNIPRRFGATDRQVVSFPLNCAVWAVSDENGSTADKSSVNKALADRISLVVSCDPTPGNEDFLTSQLMEHVLNTTTGHTPTPLLSHDCLKELVGVASSIDVQLNDDARVLLESFYTGSRRVRGSGLQGMEMPINALDSLIGIALAHAKLSLRHKATLEDATIAIVLYEESLAGRFGYSVVNIAPSPHFNDANVEACIGAELHASMIRLQKQITQFCKCSSFTNLTVTQREE